MKCSDPTVVFDTDSIFPSHGENSIDFTFKEGNVQLNVCYENKENYEENTLSFVFKHVCFQKFTSFPGINDSSIVYEKYEKIDSLIEFKYSDYKLAWEKQFNNLFKFRHFKIFFLSANHYLEIICEDLEINF